jgi:hypothetical protein
MIDKSGSVVGCTAAQGLPILARTTCDLMVKRFKYKPAIGPDGLPIDAIHWWDVPWRLTSIQRTPYSALVLTVTKLPKGKKDDSIRVALLVNPTGKLEGCNGYLADKLPVNPLTKTACDYLLNSGLPDLYATRDVQYLTVQALTVGFVAER